MKFAFFPSKSRDTFQLKTAVAYSLSEYGREIMLYLIEPGQACVLTTCLLAEQPYPAEGIAEHDLRGAVRPMSNFRQALHQSVGLRRFVFSAYGQRLGELIALVGDVAFGRIEVRLAEFLLKQANADGSLATTPQAIAVESGSAREVVSRQLKAFERNGWVRLHRGNVEILEPAVLRSFIAA